MSGSQNFANMSSLTDEIVDIIRDRILKGEYRIGEKIRAFYFRQRGKQGNQYHAASGTEQTVDHTGCNAGYYSTAFTRSFQKNRLLWKFSPQEAVFMREIRIPS